jgi:hypothetical protein
MAQTDEPASGSAPAPGVRCPWCPFAAAGLKTVLRHLEAKHPQRWRDLALSPLIADRGPV